MTVHLTWNRKGQWPDDHVQRYHNHVFIAHSVIHRVKSVHLIHQREAYTCGFEACYKIGYLFWDGVRREGLFYHLRGATNKKHTVGIPNKLKIMFGMWYLKQSI